MLEKGQLRICCDPRPTELITSVAPTSIESSDVLPRQESSLQGLGEVEVLHPAVGTADGLAVVGEEVESLVGVDHQVRARSALRQVAMILGLFLRSKFALMLELLCLRN